MTLSRSFVPKLAKKARLRFDRHSGKTMLIYPERGLELNDSAAAIAKLCDGSRSVDVIVDELAREFEAGPEARASIDGDVVAFVTDLRDRGLLE